MGSQARSLLIEQIVFANLLGGGAGAVKRAALKRLWLSACAGSNPVPRIFSVDRILIKTSILCFYVLFFEIF
jgi:hypothetical protein